MSARRLIRRVREDLEIAFGDMGSCFIDKRLEDIGIEDEEKITLSEAEKVIRLLTLKTLPCLMGRESGLKKTQLYMRWLREERARV